MKKNWRRIELRKKTCAEGRPEGRMGRQLMPISFFPHDFDATKIIAIVVTKKM